MSEVISSPSNRLIKRLRALEHRKERSASGAFVVEGILPVWRAIEHGADIETIVVAPELLQSEPARQMVERQAGLGLRIAEISTSLFRQVADRENPSGLAAIVGMPRLELDDIPLSSGSIVAALFEPSNPGNVGAIVRTVDAVGGAGVVLIGQGTDAYHPTAVKASMGTIFTVPVVQVGHWELVRRWSDDARLPIVSTSAHAENDLWHQKMPLAGLYLFGNEGEGLPPEVSRQCDMAVRIPMANGGSLNLAVAAALLLYEVRRQTEVEAPPGATSSARPVG